MGICKAEGGTQTVYYGLGELLQTGGHEDATKRSRYVVSQSFTDGYLETMETDTHPWT
jgi:hypothetical protein